MAQASKRVSRKDLRQPDQFMVATGRFVELSRTYRRQIIAAGVAVAVVLGAIAAWELYDRSQDNAAGGVYNAALGAYEAGRYEDALAGFRNVESYGSTPHLEAATLYIGNAQLALGQTKDAIKTFQALTGRIGPDTLTGQLGLLTLALAQEMDNACDAALGSLDSIVDSSPFLQEALLARARCSASVGQVDDAIRFYRQYLARFPGSDSPQITLRLHELEAQSAGG